MKCTYSLIALIKLDLPPPALPVSAMSTFTSRHFSSLVLKYFSMFDTPLSSSSFLISSISIISLSRDSVMFNRDKCSKWSSKRCGAEVTGMIIDYARVVSFCFVFSETRRYCFQFIQG